MGYTTEFEGQFNFNRRPSEEVRDALTDLYETRHGGDIRPHEGFPSMYCQWICEDRGDDQFVVCWDGGEKFYGYIDWIKYIIDNVVSKDPGLTLNGTVLWRGEDFNDIGKIKIVDNRVDVHEFLFDEEESE